MPKTTFYADVKQFDVAVRLESKLKSLTERFNLLQREIKEIRVSREQEAKRAIGIIDRLDEGLENFRQIIPKTKVGEDEEKPKKTKKPESTTAPEKKSKKKTKKKTSKKAKPKKSKQKPKPSKEEKGLSNLKLGLQKIRDELESM